MSTREQDLLARIRGRRQALQERQQLLARIGARRKALGASGRIEGPEAREEPREEPRAADESFLEQVGETAEDIGRGIGRGLSEVGHRTAIGATELVGADRTAANLRASRQLARDVYGEPETLAGAIGEGIAQLVGEGALFLVPGGGAMRVLRAIPKARRATRAGRVLRLLADPRGARQRAVQTFVTGAPLDLAISQAGPEESLAGGLAALAGTEAVSSAVGDRPAEVLQDISRDPLARGAFEVAAAFGLGEALGETAAAITRRTDARTRRSALDRIREARVPEAVTTVRDPRDLTGRAAGVEEAAGAPRPPPAAGEPRVATEVAPAREEASGDVLPDTRPDASNPQVAEAQQARARARGPITAEEAGVGTIWPSGQAVEAAPARPVTEERIRRRREQLQAEGRASPAPEAREWTTRDLVPAAVGRRQKSVFPGDDSKVETEYVVVEASELAASHTPDFTKRPASEFPPEIQGRAYHGPRGRQAQEHTERIVSRFDPDRALDPTVSAAEGPPIVTRHGIAVAGNGRIIAQQRLYQNRPDAGTELKAALEARAEEFGLGPEAVAGMREPVLVRRITDEAVDQTDIGQLRRLNQSSDVPAGKTKDVLSDAASRAEQMRSARGALDHFAATVADDATLRSYLGTGAGREFFRRLVEDGVISQSERARFVDATTGAPTEEGKQLVERMFYAAAIGDADVVARAPEGVLRKLDTALPALIRADRVEGWEIGPKVSGALDLLASARAQDMKLDDLVAQVDLERAAPDPEIVAMARFLDRAPKNGRGEQTGIKDAFRAYADDAEAFSRQTESEDLFGHEPRGPRQAGERFAALLRREAGKGGERPREASDAFTERFKSRPLRDAHDLVNPIDPAASPREKLRRITELSDENERLLDAMARDIDEVSGATSKVNRKQPDSILGKASRPSVRQKKPWHDIEHIRDTLRFKTVLNDLSQIEAALQVVLRHGARIAKVDTGKLLRPKEWGWRMVAFDLRMPNGQLVEWYLPLRELEEVKRANHLLFEKWRARDIATLTPDELRQMQADLRTSFESFDAAFDAALERSGVRRADVERSFAQTEERLRQLISATEEELAASSSRAASSSDVGRTQVSKRSSTEGAARAASRPVSQTPSRRSKTAPSERTQTSPESGSTRTAGEPDAIDTPPGTLKDTTPGGKGHGHPLVDRDLFGEEVAPSGPAQGSLLPERAGPQGITSALEDARATVSGLQGKVARGAASDAEVTRYEQARALIRRAAGEGLDEGEVRRTLRGQERPAEPGDTGDLFSQPERGQPLAPQQQASERLPSAGGFLDAAAGGPDVRSPVRLVQDLQGALSKALGGLKVAEGKLPRGGTFAKALGVIKPRSQVVRLADLSDVRTFGHEAGHAMQKLFFGSTDGQLLDAHLQGLPGAIRGELEDLARGISDESLTEGWAEVWRRYVDNPDALRTEAPNALAYVEGRLREFPAVAEAWRLAREDWTTFRESSAQARVGAKISVGDREAELLTIEDRWSRARTAVLDDLEPIRRVVDHLRQRVGLDGIAEDAETLARLTRGSVGVATHFLEHGTLDFRTLRPTGLALREIIEPVQTNLDDFRRYMVARRAQELHARDKLTGFRAEDVDTVVDELEGRFGKTFRPAFDALQDWNRALLAYLRDSGVISKEAFEAITEANQSFVPFYRIVEGRRIGRGMSETYGHLFSPVKRLHGSGRDIIDPIESMIKNALTYTHIAQRQQVSLALASLAEKEGVGEILEQLGTPVRRVQFQLGEIEKKLEEVVPGVGEILEDIRANAEADFRDLTSGMGPAEIGQLGLRQYNPAEELLAVFRPGDYFGQPNVISVLVDGERRWYEVDEELYAALQGLDREKLDGFARWLGTPARTLRAGATLAPEFLIRNPIRDQVMAFVQSEYGYTPFVDMARGMFELMRKGEAYQQWLSAGGYRAALTSLDRQAMQNSLRQLVREGGGVRNVVMTEVDALRALAAAMREAARGQFRAAGRKVGEAGRLALDPLQAASAVLEDATRMGEFLNARAVEGTTKEGLQRAAAASREISIDFARHGAKTAFLRHVAAFWNARLQGYDRLARAAKRNPARFAAKAFSIITVPSLLEYYANFDDPEYWEQPQWKRDLFWMVRVGDDWLAIPKPFELGLIFGTLPVRILDSVVGGPGGAEEVRTFFEETLLREAEGFMPTPTALQPLVENVVNYSFFLRRPITPRSEQEVRDRLQGGPYTSEAAKVLARWIPGEEGVSPRSIDNLLYAWSGGLGRLGTETLDPLLAPDRPEEPSRRVSELPGIRGVMDPPPGFSSESVERFYDEWMRARVASSTLRFLERSGNVEGYERELRDAEAAERRQREPALRRAADQLAELRAAAEAARRDEGLTADEKRQRIEELGRRAIEVARASLGRDVPESR